MQNWNPTIHFLKWKENMLYKLFGVWSFGMLSNIVLLNLRRVFQLSTYRWDDSWLHNTDKCPGVWCLLGDGCCEQVLVTSQVAARLSRSLALTQLTAHD